MLIMPGMLAGRGRAILSTVALGLLIAGPVSNVNYNINQVIESIFCMYNSMKNMACRFTNQIQVDMNYIASMTKEIQQKIKGNLKEIQEEAKKASDARELKEHLDNVKKDLERVKNIFDSISIRVFFEDTFRKRRRCSDTICGTTVPFPDVEIENMILMLLIN